MKKEVILVPKDKCPLDVLAEMEERTENSWIFMHDNVVSKLEKTASYIIEEKEYQELKWDTVDKCPAVILDIEFGGIWRKVYRIMANAIAFENEPQDPEDVFFLKMEE